MKITQKPVETPKPPDRVVIEMSQEEAGLLWWILDYYVTITSAASIAGAAASIAGAPAKRFHDQLNDYKNMHRYPYDKYFQPEVE